MVSIFKSLLKRKTAVPHDTDPMKKYLIAGLGNIGEEYSGTRHNIGFQVLDALASSQGFDFEAQKLGEVGSFKLKGRQVLALKPATYMNRSGKAIRYWMEKEKIPVENLLVITDDINLPFGTLRMKAKGSDGGHNGLKDIQQVLQHINYHRLRIGVGSDFPKGQQVDYVLGKWNSEELDAMKARLTRITDMVLSFVLAGPKQTMNEFNNT
jgi:PTH1 family peptidyl-tRNA hydrolase